MRAAELAAGSPVPSVGTARRPEPGPGDVLVKVVSAAFNRLDRMVALDPRREHAVVPGSDAAGIVAMTGADVRGVEVGDEVVIDPGLRWGPSDEAPGPSYEILGDPAPGTHAEFVVVPAENLRPKPDNLTWDEAAALPLAGVTAWRALVTRGGVRPGERVLVTGAGGGVATFLVQLAVARGATVAVTSGSEAKLERMRDLGAGAAVLHTDTEWSASLAADFGPIDLAIDSSGIWAPVIQAMRPGGRLVVLGRSQQSHATLEVREVFWRQIAILGSSMGSPDDFSQFVRHVGRAGWRPVIDSVWPFDRYDEAIRRVDDPARIGKVVLAVGSP